MRMRKLKSIHRQRNDNTGTGVRYHSITDTYPMLISIMYGVASVLCAVFIDSSFLRQRDQSRADREGSSVEIEAEVPRMWEVGCGVTGVKLH